MDHFFTFEDDLASEKAEFESRVVHHQTKLLYCKRLYDVVVWSIGKEDGSAMIFEEAPVSERNIEFKSRAVVHALSSSSIRN